MLRNEIRILVVDDVNSMRIQIKHLLIGFGFHKVVSAENGEEAKAALAVNEFHLIVSDWQMSPTNGFDLLKYVRSQHKFKDIAFIMVTAEGTKEKVIEAIQAGVDDYLVKPLTLEQIENKVYKVLTKKQVIQ